MSTATEQEPHRALRRDASENRRRVLDAARHVFAEHGLEAGVEEVAQVAGVGIGTLYRRFPTKDALVAELVRELLGEIIALAHAASELAEGRGLERFLYDVGEAQAYNRGCLARLWCDDATIALREEARMLIAALLADAQRSGRIRADAVLTDVDLLFWSLRGIIEAAGDTPSAALQRQIAITIAGLRPGSEPLAASAMPCRTT